MTTLKLGDFVFARGELPESIAFGATQQLHVHTLVGGARVIDAMGAVPLRQEWSGWFIGPQALVRARFLKRLAENGQPLALRYGEFAYTVVIAEFSAEFRAGPNLPYAIALEVVSDDDAVGGSTEGPGIAQAIAQDLIGAAANASAIGDDGLIAGVGAASAALASSDGAIPASAAMQIVSPTIAAAQSQAAGLDLAVSAQISALGTLAAPQADGNPVGPEALAHFAAGLAAAAEGIEKSCLLNATVQMLGRAAKNFAAAQGTAGGATITVGSTDLYHLAAAAYGDARGWARIAQANRLTDPMISGITQLVLPSAAVSATGVLHG